SVSDYGAGVRTSARDRSVSRRPRLASIEEEDEEEKGRAVRCRGDAMWLTRGEADLYLGVDLIGHSLYDFAHPCDHKEIENNLHISGDCCWPPQRDFVMRMKSTLTHRGRTTNIKSATWKVLHCEGRLKACTSSSSSSCPSCPSCSSYLLLSCKPLLLCHRLVVTHTFTSQHRLDLCFTRCDQSAAGRNAANHSAHPSPACIFSITYILSGVLEPSLQLSLTPSDLRHVT
ncbi:hypothetical protein CRUP_031625, partial [Coryphaenoides rupestris]